MGEFLLEVKSVTKSFPGVTALDNVSISVRRGEVHALCGENGAGKSTLIKILSGIYPHGSYNGTILFEGDELVAHGVKDVERIGISTIFQELTLFKKLTVAENLFIGDWPNKRGFVDWNKIRQETKELLEEVGLEVDPESKIESLGIGQQQLVEIAKAIKQRIKLLILDEPTSALSDSEVEKLFGIIRKLKARGVTCIYISHKLEEVFKISDRATVLRDGRVISTDNVSEIGREYLITKMVGREMQNIYPRIDQKRSELILEVKDWNVYKDKSKSRKLIHDVNLRVYSGEILGVAGLMGAGRTELASSLFGLYDGLTSGTMLLRGLSVRLRNPHEAIKAGLAYLPEDRKRHGLVLGMSISANITLASLRSLYKTIINARIEEECAVRSIEKFHIKASKTKMVVNNLSGGNQQKVVIGKWLLTKPDVLILDEVTRGIDVGAKYEIYKIINKLVQDGVAVVMISSELPELIGVCNRIVVMHEGRLKGELSGADISQEDIMTCAMSIE